MRSPLWIVIVLLGAASASATAVPFVEIKAEATRRWPKDHATQQIEINRQVKAYKIMANYQAHDVPVEILSEVLKGARLDWPTDYWQQEYTVNKQLTAYRRLHRGHYAHVPENIRAQAAIQWPGDFYMQEYTIKQQYAAYLRLLE